MNLSLHHLVLGHHPDHPLTSEFSAQFQQGGMHVILGGNGSGKTTLLRSVLGIQSVLSGTIGLDDGAKSLVVQQGGAWKKHMAYVASTPPREVGLTVREVLELSGSHEGAAKRYPRLMPWLNRRLSELSDGQKQQVMVARAMLQSQSWIVLDEPTAFLDVKGQADLWDMLTRHLEREGSVLMATHDVHGVLRWAQSNEHSRGSGSLSVLGRDGLESVPWGIEEQMLIDKLTGSPQS